MTEPGGNMMMSAGMAIPFLLFLVLLLALFIWLAVRILHRAGYSGWWSLLGLVPLVNFVMIWVFAYAEWPCLKKDAASAIARQGQL